jgi:phenylacetate-CoA ligase
MTRVGLGTAALRDLVRLTLRQGGRFHRLLDHFQELERLPPAGLAAYQTERLRWVFKRAGEHVPHYRQLFDRSGWSPDSFTGLDDLSRLPLLDKATVRARPRDFRDGRVWLAVRGQTSGSTGTPLTVWRDLDAIIHENAMIWRQRGWFGVKPGDPIAVLRGEIVATPEQSAPPFWRLDRSAHELILSSHHLAPKHARHYVEALRRFTPAALYAYPSSAAELARLIRDLRLEPPPLRAVFTASETLRPEDAALIAAVFRAPVVDRYGNAERTIAGGHCERSGYHLWTDMALAELLPGSDGVCELVGTPLHGSAMPLLRYRTGDQAVPGPSICPCGRAFPLVARIDGRLDPPIVLPDGRRIGRLDHIWKGIEHIAGGQIVQDSDLTVRLRVIPEPGFSEQDRARIEAQARARLGREITLVIEQVDRLPRTAAGKFLTVVSHVAPVNRPSD